MDRKAGYMRNDVIFINAIIVITLLYSLIQGGQLIFMGGRVEKADAEIIKTRYAALVNIFWTQNYKNYSVTA